MNKAIMIKKYFLKIFLSSSLIILVLFLFVFTAFLMFPKKTAESVPATGVMPPTATAKPLILYGISGKIKSIENNKIQLETLTVDSITKPLSEKKLEIRELKIGDSTKIMRLNFIPKKKGVKMPENPTADSFGSFSSFKAEYTAAISSDLKVGDNIGADYSSDLTEIKNFTPTTVTILPYTVY